MPVVPWKSGALALRKARRIYNGLQPPLVAIAAMEFFRNLFSRAVSIAKSTAALQAAEKVGKLSRSYLRR